MAETEDSKPEINRQMSAEEMSALKSAELGAIQKEINAASWNNHAEDLMCSWGEKAAGLRWMHNKCSSGWKKLSNNLTLTGIVLTTLSSGLTFVSTGLPQSTEFTLGIGAVTAVSAFVQSLQKFYNAEEKASNHGVTAKQFGSFYRAMTVELGYSRSDRRPSDQVMSWASREYDRLQQEALPISKGVVSAFKKEFHDSDNIPDVAAQNFDIKIYRD